MSAAPIRVGARGVSRRFGAVLANDEVDLAVAPGTIHAIVGENGAGKTTLMRILGGLDRPDTGTVVVDGEPVSLGGPGGAAARGIGMVHQEFKLVGELSLLENLILGREPTRRGRLDLPRARAEAEELARDAGVELDWGARTDQTSVATRQRLEILRLLYREADVLILDEPTAVLAPPQVAELMRLLRALRDRGRTILFISHKLAEVLELADDVTVLRGGRVTGTTPAAEATPEQLVSLMVGEAVPAVRVAEAAAPGEPLLEVEGLRVLDGLGRERVCGVDLEVRAGEVVGIAGVAGNGQDELVDAIVGLRRARAGTVRLAGSDVTRAGVAGRRRRGLAYIPADRRREGLSVASSLIDNAVAGAHRTPALARSGWFRRGAAAARTREIVDAYRVRSGSLEDPANGLSGGNQQRLVLGRELYGEPQVVIAAQPSRGVDVKGAAYIREQLLALRGRGAAVLLISEELDELTALSDRIVVLTGGRVAGEVPGPVDDYGELGRLMTGAPA